MTKRKPLAGLRILDLTRLLPGPMCTLFLADLGAEVIKVEEPGVGDYARLHPPIKERVSSAFLLLNRNKSSVTLDLNKETDRRRFYALVKTSDAVIESFRPGVTKKLKIDYATLKRRNPKLVYCSLTGYGQKGLRSQEAGHDINYLALSGLLEQMGSPDHPSLINFQIADLSGSLVAAVGILSALFDRQRGGPGRYIDISLLQSALSLAVLPFSYLQATGKTPKRGLGILSGGIPGYNLYRTKDDKFMAVGALEKKFWTNLCLAIERKDLEHDGADFGKKGQQAQEELKKVFQTRTQDYWTRKFSKIEACVTPVLSFAEAFDFLKSKEMLVRTEHPTEGEIWQLSSPIRMSDFTFSADLPAPGLGEQNNRILKIRKQRARD